MQSKSEKKFIDQLKKQSKKYEINDTHPIKEGFEYLHSKQYKAKPGAVQSRGKKLLTSHGMKDTFRLVNHMRKRMPSMLRNINKNFSDMTNYLEEKVLETPNEIVASYPNDAIWKALKAYAWDKYKLTIGFTEIPNEYIFEGKAIPFKYALIFSQEMNQEAIEKAPELDAGMEVINVYNSLGIATNEISDWLRKKFGIVCMANHPLGGLLDFIPLAEKAGLGKIGRHGLLITKEFGPRCRISPILVDKKIFNDTATEEHDWIESFCKQCGQCVKNCSENAIYEEAKLTIHYEGINNRYSAFDIEKCFQSFSSHMGCSVCIKVCPFSKNPRIYGKLSSNYRKEEKNA